MRIGFPLWYGNRNRIKETLSEMVKTGFDYVEVSLDYPWPFKGEVPWSEVIRIIRDSGLKAAFHGPWRDVRLSSPIKEIRDTSIRVCKEFLKAISNVEADYVVLHLSTDQAIEESPKIRDEAIKAAIKSAEEMMSLGRELGLKVIIENVRERLDEFRRVVEKTNSNVCLDVSHAARIAIRREGKKDAVKSVERWIDALRERIRVVHLSGFVEEGYHVRDHLLINEDDPCLKLIMRELGNLKVNNLLLEIFRDLKNSEVRPSQLFNLVRLFKPRL